MKGKEENGIEMSVCRGFSTSILQGICSRAGVCVSQALTLNLRALVETASCCVEVGRLVGIDVCLRILEDERYVCMS